MDLFLVEMRRNFARRITRLAVITAVAGILVSALIVFSKHEKGPRGTDFRGADLPGILMGTTVPLVILAWLLGASFIGAEWRAGTVGTQLTWEPRRARLMLTKALAAVTTAVILTLFLQLFLSLALLPSALLRGSTFGFDGGNYLSVLARGTALAGMGAAVGFSIGALGRNTAAALGIGFVYLSILEGGLLGGIFPGIRRWLIVGNSIVFMTGESTSEVAGRSVIGASVVLTAYAAGAVAVATAVFRRRDVT